MHMHFAFHICISDMCSEKILLIQFYIFLINARRKIHILLEHPFNIQF